VPDPHLRACGRRLGVRCGERGPARTDAGRTRDGATVFPFALERTPIRSVLGMTTPQHSIGSPFGAHSTAAEVLRGIDLSGKLAVVTGGYSGLGLETTRALASAGARVVVPARRPETAQEAVGGIEGVEIDTLDLADLGSVRAFAERFLDSGRGIDVLINNAGVMACPETRVGPGWEAQFATNHLGHYALVNRLWPAIAQGGARVVSVSSAGHRRSGMRWDDVHFERGYDKWEAYGQAKTANVLFAVQLDALGRESGVRAFSLHPGGILTPLQRHLPTEEMVALGWIDEDGNPLVTSFKTPEAGAATQVWAATSPQLEGMGGVYCEDCDIAELAPSDPASNAGGVRDYAVDPEEAARLWTLSAELTGVDAFSVGVEH
jgi:NAD(P)-dependent dehydrogenase (short-subunit alcohol dehydrogenase family)